jgi:hypothetical protein
MNLWRNVMSENNKQTNETFSAAVLAAARQECTTYPQSSAPLLSNKLTIERIPLQTATTTPSNNM